MGNHRSLLTANLDSIFATRRRILQLSLAGVSIAVAAPLLAACADQDDDDSDAPAAEDDDEDVTSEDDDDSAIEPDDEDDDDADEEAPATDDEDVSGAIHVGMVGDGRTLDPPAWTNINERHFIPQIFDNLLEVDENYELRAALAQSWESNEDGLEWTFDLQEGVLFHDGTELDAEAVVYNFNRILDPENDLRHREQIQVVESVEAIDDLRFTLRLSEVFTPILPTITEAVGYIGSPTAIEELGENFASQPVGAGPFKFVEWELDNRLVLERFDDYWREGLPRASGVVFQPIPDTAVKLTNLRTGDIDLVDEVAPQDISAVEDDDELELYTLEGSRWPMMRLNTILEPFDNVHLRRAVALATNRDNIIQAVYFGQGSPAFGPISPLYESVYNPEIESEGLGFDPEQAMEELEEAGFPDGFEFELDTVGTSGNIRTAEVIQAALASVNITMEINTLESAAFTERLRGREFQAALGSWTPRPDVDGIIYQHFHTDGLANWVSYSNPEVDELLDQTRSAPLGEERDELFREAERIIVSEAPWVVLVFEQLGRVARSTVSGYQMSPDTLLHLREVRVEDRD